MRKLTDAETELLQKMKNRFFLFLEEKSPVLSDFAGQIGADNKVDIIVDPPSQVHAVSDYMSGVDVGDRDFNWYLARVGYFVGEVLCSKMSGNWKINEVPDSRTFLKYVVGDFDKGGIPGAMIDPFEVGIDYLRVGNGRRLEPFIDEIVGELMAN